MSFQIEYPLGSIPRFTTNNRDFIVSLAEIWDLIHSDDNWIDLPFYVDERFFRTRADYNTYYKIQHELYFK